MCQGFREKLGLCFHLALTAHPPTAHPSLQAPFAMATKGSCLLPVKKEEEEKGEEEKQRGKKGKIAGKKKKTRFYVIPIKKKKKTIFPREKPSSMFTSRAYFYQDA